MCGCVKYASAGELAWLSASPWSRFANRRCRINGRCGISREALQIAIKPRLVGREPYGVRTEASLRFSRRAANWSLIACYENFFQQRAVNE